MKATELEFTKELKSFYQTLKLNIFLYLSTIVSIIGAAFSSYLLIELMYVCLAILFLCVWTLHFGYFFMKLFSLDIEFDGHKMNYFLACWLKTTIDDAKKIKNLLINK